MTQTLRPERKVPTRIVELIVRYFHKQAKPVYLGRIASEVGISLERAQETVDDLCHDGIVRIVEPDEKKRAGLSERANVYVLTGEPNLTLANKWPGE